MSAIRRSAARALKRGRVAIETLLVVLALILVKLLLEALSLEFIDLSPLYTSIVAGGIFVIGLIVAGTLADYKESEKMPAEITAALENVHEDCRSIRRTTPEFDLERVRKSLSGIVAALRKDLGDPTSRTCLDAINELSPSFLELERLGVPPNYIVRLRTEQGTVRKNVLRIYHIQRIEFLPSAYLLIQTIVLIIAGLGVHEDRSHLPGGRHPGVHLVLLHLSPAAAEDHRHAVPGGRAHDG